MPPRNIHIIIVAIFISIVCFATAKRAKRAILVGDAIALIDRYYVDPVESESLVEAAMTGLTSSLDQHSEFIPADMYSAFNDVIQQEFAGVGILVEQPEIGKPVRVITPLVGSPALEAGVMPADEIVAIGGEDVSKMEIRDVSNRLRGPIDTDVVITVRREVNDETKQLEIRLTRKSIALESVVGDHRDADDRWIFRLRKYPEIAYVRVTSFGEKTESELRQVFSEELGDDYEALILDVRGNSGGLLVSAVNICDQLIDSGRIVTIKTRGGKIDAQYDATPGTLVPTDVPVVILVDGNSASASEILAACLQDHRRATVIGSRSFGKGTVQNVLPLESGRSALKLTTARYYRPNGKNIHRIDNAPEDEEWGVSPDEGMAVTMTDEAYRELVLQWQRASFPVSSQITDAIGTKPQDVTSSEPANPAAGENETLPLKPPAASSKDAQGRVIDPQLNKAIEFLKRKRVEQAA
jgi:carboxyl-terminal processing protease